MRRGAAPAGPALAADGDPLKDEVRVAGRAAAWVRALLAGHEVVEGGEGRALRRANGAVFLSGATTGGPLQRRAELETLAQEVRGTEAARDRAVATLAATVQELAAAEAAFADAGQAAEHAREAELDAGAQKGEAERAVVHARRQAADAAGQVERLSRRLAEVETRLATLQSELQQGQLGRGGSGEQLGAERARLVDLEAQQEAAREQRVHWQEEAGPVEARQTAARQRAARAAGEAAAGPPAAAAPVDRNAAPDRD